MSASTVLCASCGQETPGGFPRCANCGAPLALESAPAREERKVVTVLFCDLVGSTARAEGADPEDVRALLSAYHERVRSELERFGGTVEKFIGDAVMALFGAPVAHEDDPERAVRAALAIRDWATEDGDLQVRIGITTGEALVALGARREAGEGMASGDVVNTASRLQSAAPANGIVVDETTYRATERVIDYGERDAVAAKGKSESLLVWEAVRARSRVQVERAAQGPLLGRDKELDILVDALRRVRDEREPQLVTLVGVPGIGKSRLVYELFRSIETGGQLTYWRHGRSLPYGEGASFWALGETVKAQAGILESDDGEQAGEKLRRAVTDVVAEDADWVESHLRPLVGLGGERALGADRQPESFAAWRRFFEALADQRPLVLVFEDLHFADDGLLDFVDYFVDWASGIPVLVVGTARPELLSRRPGWGGGKPNALTLSLSPLSDEETAQLVHALLERPVLAAELQETLLERAGGNPLYAEEFVRMLGERGDGELALPETVQGLIAARLDGLLPEEKGLLQGAAVLGKVFWLGAAAELAEAERSVAEERLHALERKEFVRRERRSSVAGDLEYTFRHLLVRDVAYGQIPRAARADKHVLAAGWIESLGRPEDHAELLAHHYLAALELARAARRETGDLVERARFALREAGDRALELNASVALGFYRRALELTPSEAADRGRMLFLCGKAQYVAEEAGADVLTEAGEALAVDEPEAAAEAEVMVADIVWRAGERDRAAEHLRRADVLLADMPPSRSKAYLLGQLSRFHMLAGESDDAVRFGEEALRMAEELELDDLRAFVLNNIGSARMTRGELEGVDELERSVAIAEEIRDPWHTVRGYSNLGGMLVSLGDLRRGAALHEQADELNKRFGIGFGARFLPAEQAMNRYWAGRWEEAERIANNVIAWREQGTRTFVESWCRYVRGAIRLARDDRGRALADTAEGLELARYFQDTQVLWPALACHARTVLAAGREQDAGALVDELLERWEGPLHLLPWAWIVDLAWAARAVGREQRFLEASSRAQMTRWLEAAAAIVSGDVAGAARMFGEMGDVSDEAYARLRAAEVLAAEGRRAEADESLERALAFYRSVGATRYIRESETLLAASA
jgi:class 3 adenylate cyclase/tetratricopeptide (TPR) repeat protein